jgi:Tat protein secretion system quality control protein TatD with DNase activity
MKIQVTNYGKTYTIESEEDHDVEGVADMFKSLLVSMGYHPCNVDALFNTEYKWFTEEELEQNLQGHQSGSNAIVNKWYNECLNESKESFSERKKRVEEWQNNLYRPEDDDFDEYDMFK